MNDPEFDTAWRDFAKQDAQMTAPARVRTTVMAAWDSAQQAQRDRVLARSRRVSFGVMLAVAAAVILVLGITIRDNRGTDRSPAGIPVAPTAPTFGVSIHSDSFRLIADPAFEGEAFEIVRLRMPRTSLEGFGVTWIEPDSTTLVDVDVVVGGDGLPRSIQGIRPVVAVQ